MPAGTLLYGFDTSNEEAAVGALLVYGVWRSRDVAALKITPEIWGMVERAVKSCAKRAADLHEFLEDLKPRLKCATIHPRYMTAGQNTVTFIETADGELLGGMRPRREFWTAVLEDADHKAVLEALYGKTGWIIALVRDRIEREKPVEMLAKEDDGYGE